MIIMPKKKELSGTVKHGIDLIVHMIVIAAVLYSLSPTSSFTGLVIITVMLSVSLLIAEMIVEYLLNRKR